MNKQTLNDLTALLNDSIKNLDEWSVQNEDYINEEVASLYEIGGKLFTKIQSLKEPVDPKELYDALSYFHTADKYGQSPDLDDKTDTEIVELYKQALKHEDDYEDPRRSDEGIEAPSY